MLVLCSKIYLHALSGLCLNLAPSRCVLHVVLVTTTMATCRQCAAEEQEANATPWQPQGLAPGCLQAQEGILTTSNLISSHLISSHLISSHLISSHLMILRPHPVLRVLHILLLSCCHAILYRTHVSGKMSVQVSVLGPFANSPEMLLGNYYGTPAGPVTTPFEAVKV